MLRGHEKTMVDQISKIESLSPARVEKIEELCLQWRTSARSSLADRAAVEQAMTAIYENAGLNTPSFIWCQSVFQYVTMNAFLFLIANDPTDEMKCLLDSELKEPLWVKSWMSFKAQLDRAPELVEQMRSKMKEVADGKPIIKRSSLGSTHLMEHVGNTNVEMKLNTSISEATGCFEKVLPDAFGVKAKLQLRMHLSQLREVTSAMFRGRFPERTIRSLVPGDVANELIAQLSEASHEKLETCCECLTKQTGIFDSVFDGSRAPKPKAIELLFRDMLGEHTRLIPDRLLPAISDQMLIYAFVADELRHVLEDKALRVLDSHLTIIENGVDYSPYRIVCFISEPPQSAVFNQRNFLHNQDGPAMSFRDGYQVFSINGVSVPANLLRESISIEQIDAQQNVEIRRIMIERYGMEKYIEDSGARVISSDEYGILYKKDLAMDEPIVIVKVINATKEPDGSDAKEFFLRVPPYMMTAKDAVAWTFQMDGTEYKPDQES